MARRKDDFSFEFSRGKDERKPDPASQDSEDSEPSTHPPASADLNFDPFAADGTSEPTGDQATDLNGLTEAPTDPAPADPLADLMAAMEAPAEESPGEETQQEREALRARRHPQFRILILGDFSGRMNRGVMEAGSLSARKVHTVDADTLDATVAKVKPEIRLPVNAQQVVPLSFRSLADFRPDALLQQVEAFRGMLALREQLKDNRQFKNAAAAVRKLIGAAPPQKPRAAESGAVAGSRDDFERLLNQPVAPKDAGAMDADALIASLVAGYGVPDADPEQARLVGLMEDALSAGLRAVLRHPAFQAVEAAWRGVELLTSRLDLDGDLKVCILDVSKAELFADLSSAATIDKSQMYQVLVERTRAAGGVPYSLVIGDYEFDQSPENVALLAKLAGLMHEAGIPLVAGATARVAGYAAFNRIPGSGKWQPPADLALWNKMRGHKYAAHIALAAPRFLLRLPYGPRTDAIDTYPFEEMPADKGPVFEGYLWGNAAFAVGLLIGQAFLEAGGTEGLEPGNDVSDLPCHMAMVEGDREMTPCAEAFLSDRIGDILHGLGVIPVLSVRNAAAVKVAGIHSIAADGRPLAAAWAG